MKKKSTGGRSSSGQGPKSSGRAAGPGQGARKQGAKKGGDRPKSAAPRPAWMPEPPPRGFVATAPRTTQRSAPRPQGRGEGAPVDFRDPHADREASRYEQPIASRELILRVLADGPMSADALATKLDLAAPDRFDALNKRLAAMVREGQLLLNRRGEFAPAERLDLIAGTVIANPDGFGFLRTDAGGDDLFLPPFEMRKAMHGDRVLASVTGMDRRGRREGAIVEVLERRLNRLIGRFEIESGISYVVPDDRRIQRNVHVPPDERGDAKHGQLVVVELTQAPDSWRPPIGRVLTVLGERLTASLAVKAAIHGHELPHEFPQAVLSEAAAVPLTVDAAKDLLVVLG